MHSLPITVESKPMESAGSVLLRCFTANGVTPRDIYAEHGTPWAGEFLAHELPWLAEVAGCSLEWLRRRTPLPLPGQAKAWLEWQWLDSSTFAGIHPQVCTQCVHSSGYCRLEWDLRFFCACPVHRCLLQRQCNHCDRVLTWGRPAIDTCRCRRLLQAEDEHLAVSDVVLEWLSWTSDCLAADGALPPLPPLWAFLPGDPAPNALWAVIRAFGVRLDQTEPFRARRATAQLSPLQTCRLVERAHARLVRLTRGGVDEGDVDTRLLRRSAERAHAPFERDVVEHCLQVLRHGPGAWPATKGVHQLGLFE